jgi:hypothetical protein
LPQHFRTLVPLAALNLSPPRLAKCVLEERIGPNSTAADIRKLGESLGLIKPKKPAAKKSAEPAAAVIPALAWAYTRTSAEKRSEFFDAVGIGNLCRDMSIELLIQFRDRLDRNGELRDRLERERQPAKKKAAAKTAPKLVASRT